MVKINNKNTKTISMTFTPFFSGSIFDFEQVNVNWTMINFMHGQFTYYEELISSSRKSEVQLGLCQISGMGLFAQIVSG